MIDIPLLWKQASSPLVGFRESLALERTLGAAAGRMLLLRVPVAVLDAILIYWNARLLWGTFRTLDGRAGRLVQASLPQGVSLEEVRVLLGSIPDLPGFWPMLPWLGLVGVLGIVGMWLHHAVWDHTCLWMLRGLKARRSFKTSLVAEAEALSTGVFGALLGLLASLPLVGCVFGTLSTLAGIWFWGLRGVALAVHHDCPVWKGVLATILHVLLLVLFAGLLLLGMGALVAVSLVGP